MIGLIIFYQDIRILKIWNRLDYMFFWNVVIWRMKNMQNLIHVLNLQGHIQLLGPCFQGEVTKLYDWCQVLVLSSWSEGTPMVIIEAMAKARPVIAPRITAIPEMVVEGQSGYLFRQGDAEDLARQLSRLMAQPQDLVRFGLAGRRRALELFDLNRNARKLMAVFARELPWVPGDQEISPP